MIRRATREDFPRLSLLADLLSAEHEARGEAPIAHVVKGGFLAAFDLDVPVWVWVSDLADLVGAFCLWLPTASGRAQGLGTYVQPQWRRRGISPALREKAEESMAALGQTSVEGVAVIGNEAGLMSALKQGFRVVGYLVRKELRDEGQGQGSEGRQGRQELRAEGLLTGAGI